MASGEQQGHGGDPHERGFTKHEIEKRFTYAAPKGDQPQRYVALRAAAKNLCELIVAATPPSREQSLAITKLEESVMWANAAIARRE